MKTFILIITVSFIPPLDIFQTSLCLKTMMYKWSIDRSGEKKAFNIELLPRCFITEEQLISNHTPLVFFHHPHIIDNITRYLQIWY